ncbi:hypothetical protein RHIZ404_220078 [Rhizobium sp. EC-SD404]|nr:hypothetical protein RHIZ404_220078 [Rhizobium sp. EC-SD404]
MEDLIRRTVGPAITVETVATGGLWSTFVDPPQLENALLNLSYRLDSRLRTAFLV